MLSRLALHSSLALTLTTSLGLAACGDDDGPSGTPDGSTAGTDAQGGDAQLSIDGPLPDGAPTGWQPPACDTIHGTGAVTFSRDEGATLAPTDVQLSGVVYTMGLVALDLPGRMLAAFDSGILYSTDSGCSWSRIGDSDRTPKLTAAPGGRAYGFVDNDVKLIRVDAAGDSPIITILAPPHIGGSTSVIGLGVDQGDPTGAHLRLGDSNGQLWESTDAGESWDFIGVPAVEPGKILGYRIAFDPADLDHALFGEAGGGAHVTIDGGATWVSSTGLSATPDGRANAFQLAVSPADPNVVWAQGIDLADLDPEHARQMFRSTDGGFTFTSLFHETPEVTLVNGPTMAPHPTDADILYFVFGTNYANEGTWIYRYDDSTGQVTRQHNTYHDVFAITFLPGDPSVMYLGLTIEQI
jgi:hypothetical protein